MVYGKMGTDRQERINYDRMRKYRLERAKEMMNEYGLGTVITWNPSRVRYLTGATGMGTVVLTRNGKPYLYGPLDGGRRAEEMPWLEGRIRAPSYGGPPSDFIKEIANIMDEYGVKNEPICLDGDAASMHMEEAFKEAGINAVRDDRAFVQARLIKGQDEIECMRIACANAEAAFTAITDAIRPGVTECELAGIGTYTLCQLGAEDVQPFVIASGERTNPLRYDYTDKQIRPGDMIVLGAWRGAFQGYRTCYWRTVCCGKATAEQKELHEELRSMVYDGMSAVKAGATGLDIVKKWPADPRHWGYEKWGEDPIQAALVAHSLGLDSHEFDLEPLRPYAPETRLKEIVLEENMVLAVEANIGHKIGNGYSKDGGRLEEEVVVTKDGYDQLSRFPIDELIECGI